MMYKMGMKAKRLIYCFSLLSSSQAGEIEGRIYLSISALQLVDKYTIE